MKRPPTVPQREVFPIGERNGLELTLVKRNCRDIGVTVATPDSSNLIADVRIEAGTIHPDDRGFFTELFRVGSTRLTEGLRLPLPLQVSAALSYPGIIKALHYHFEQTDYWAPVQGMFQIVLCDLRENSKTHGVVNTLYLGSLRPWRLKIPPGIGHGYKVLGVEPGVLVYLTDRYYNPQDEGRLAYNHPFLNYDWELQRK